MYIYTHIGVRGLPVMELFRPWVRWDWSLESGGLLSSPPSLFARSQAHGSGPYMFRGFRVFQCFGKAFIHCLSCW